MPGVQLIDEAWCTPADIMATIAPNLLERSGDALRLLINSFSQFCVETCNHSFKIGQYTEQVDAHGGSVWTRVAPIDISQEIIVWEDGTREFASTTKLVLHDDYRVNAKQGHIRRRRGFWTCEPQAIKIQYSGGSIDTSDEESPVIPAHLRGAAIMQIAAWWRQRKFPNLIQNYPGETGGTGYSVVKPGDILPHVMQVILAEKQHRFA